MVEIYRSKMLLSALLGILFGSSALCQTAGKIEGKVEDATTGEGLPGANVILQGSSLGGSTDLNGNFEILNVPPGSYSIRVTYIGYDPLIVDAQLKGGVNLNEDFKLQPVALKGQEVVVTAQASGQNQAINQQLTSMQITNVVSAARIQELPDANAAESVARLPGISVLRTGGEADKVVIRGLDPKYNEVTINGVQMAGSDASDRSVDLSMISSNMLERIDVSKTVTPDMDANVVGGVVNYDLRQASGDNPGVPKFTLLAQGAYNGLADAYNKFRNYKYAASFEDRLFDARLGVFAQGSFERKNLSSNELNASYFASLQDPVNEYSVQSVQIDDISRDRQRGNAVLAFDYKLPEGKIILSNFVSSGVTKAEDRQQLYNVAGGDIQNFNAINTNGTLNTLTNLLSYDQQFGIFHLKAGLSHSYSETRDPADWTVSFINGDAGIPDSLRLGTNIYPRDIVSSANNSVSNSFLYTVQTQYTFTRERNMGGSLDLDTRLDFSSEITSIVKVGGKYQHQSRSYNADYIDGESLTYASGAAMIKELAHALPWVQTTADSTTILMGSVLDQRFNYGKFLGGDYMMVHPLDFTRLQSMVDYMNAHQIPNNINYNFDIGNSEQSDYSGSEDISAAYAMTTVDFGSVLTVIPGVRFQQLKTDYISLQGQRGPNPYSQYFSQLDTAIAYHHYWLPDVLVRIKPTEWCDVRLAYTNTLSYPDYASLAPIVVVNLTADQIQWNGFQLSPMRSTNYDAYFSFYNNSIGLFTAGAFLKQITDLIYQYSFEPTAAQLANYWPSWMAPPTGLRKGPTVAEYINNPYKINDYGMEMDWQTNFWYLPGPLTGLVLNVNYTHIFSKAEYLVPLVTNQRTGESVQSAYYDPLLYQPDDIVNLTIGYDYSGFSIRVSSIYSAKIFTTPSPNPVTRASTSAYNRWDIALKQDLPIKGFAVYCNLDNINGANDISVISSPNAVPRSEQSYDFAVELGLRCQL